MNIQFETLLRDELFDGHKVLAGRAGLQSRIKRVSVFDCPCVTDILDRKILSEGDVFITCLEQFREDTDGKEIRFYFECLIKARCAGLLVVSEDRTYLLTQDILKLCDDSGFAVVVIPQDHPYTVILDTVHNYLSSDAYNTINMLKLDKIMYENISDAAKSEVLHSIKPTIRQYVKAIFVQGEFNSDIAKLELQHYYLNRDHDIFVRNDQGMIILLSEDDEKKLRPALDACIVRIREFMDNPVIGYSRNFARKNCGKALDEARRALETARTMNMTVSSYHALSTIQILTTVKDTQEAEDYYDAYISALRSKISEESIREVVLTIENYVANSGDFKATAEMMNQHVNTIRYRVNKAKSALGMEDDAIKFHETIAIAVKLRVLLNRKI